MTDLDLDAIEASHPDEPGINPFVRPLVAALREARAEVERLRGGSDG